MPILQARNHVGEAVVPVAFLWRTARSISTGIENLAPDALLSSDATIRSVSAHIQQLMESAAPTLKLKDAACSSLAPSTLSSMPNSVRALISSICSSAPCFSATCFAGNASSCLTEGDTVLV